MVRCWTCVLLSCLFPALAFADGGAPPSRDALAIREEASRNVRAMEGNAIRVHRLLIRARETGSKADARCVDESLSRADAALRAARDDASLATGALDHGDFAEARRRLSLLGTERAASRSAARDADACVTHAQAPVGVTDQTAVRVVVDPSLPSDATLFGS